MKRIISLILLSALAVCLFGCGNSNPENEAIFCYPRNPAHQNYRTADTFYGSEERELSGSSSDLRYLLSLYLQGPLNDDLLTPYPQNTRLVYLNISDRDLHLRLSEEFTQLTGMDLTVACVCLSLTCFGLADVDQVTILSPATANAPAVEMTITRDMLTLTDTVIGES